MKTQDFEEKLNQMTKPEVTHLKHEDMLADALITAKDKSALSWWWLSVPLYIIAAFIMKSFFMPRATFIVSMHEFSNKEKILSVAFFLIAPLVFSILNFLSIRRIYRTVGIQKMSTLLQTTWFNFLMILLSILILIIYLL